MLMSLTASFREQCFIWWLAHATVTGLRDPGIPFRCPEVLLALRLTRRPALPVTSPCFILIWGGAMSWSWHGAAAIQKPTTCRRRLSQRGARCIRVRGFSTPCFCLWRYLSVGLGSSEVCLANRVLLRKWVLT
jgi:hypothetical protein